MNALPCAKRQLGICSIISAPQHSIMRTDLQQENLNLQACKYARACCQAGISAVNFFEPLGEQGFVQSAVVFW